MASPKDKILNLFFFLWLISIACRKYGLPFSGLLFIVATITCLLLCCHYCWSASRKKHVAMDRLIFLLIFLLMLPKFQVSYAGDLASKAAAIFSLSFIIFQVINRTLSSIPVWKWILLLTACCCGMMSSRQFHHMIRKSYFENYVSDRFPAGSLEAVKIINENTPYRIENINKAHVLFLQAIKAYNNKNAEDCFDLVCHAIDLNPDQPKAYLLRGKTLLLLMELNEENSNRAIKDFTRTIALDSNLGEAYFRRAMAMKYRNHNAHVCTDLEKAYRSDTSYRKYILEMADSNCSVLLRQLAPALHP